MSKDKKTTAIKFGTIFLLCLLAYNVIETSFVAIYTIYIKQNIQLPNNDVLFSSLVITLVFLMLWKAQKIEIALLILGEFFVLIGAYIYSLHPFYIVIETIGAVLFIPETCVIL